MNEGINISLAEVTATASSIRSTNAQLDATLRKIMSDINSLNTSWESEAGETIRGRISAMTPRFDQYRDVVESYGKFLEQTVAAYTQTETSVNQAASSFR